MEYQWIVCSSKADVNVTHVKETKKSERADQLIKVFIAAVCYSCNPAVTTKTKLILIAKL
jgi:hypothetical protein